MEMLANLMFILLLAFSLALVTISKTEDPVINTLNGPVKGFKFKLPRIERKKTDVEVANIFLGIPYAVPPVSDLRFERPKPIENWTEPLDATEFALGCVPHHPIASFSFDEDCLYLNVFAPDKKSASPGGYPVLVFIHGGGFCAGSTSQFGYEVASDNFVSQSIIVITLQYRLGMMGFFSNGDSKMPGNMGLWDQRQALVWIKNNIDRFGGNPERITLWGQSAGAASTSMHSLSKHSRGLFQQIILHSGSPYAKWSTNENVVEMSQNLAKTLNCPIDDSNKLKTCMKNLDLEDIMDAASEFPLARNDLAFLNYNPRFDGDFFDADHEELMADAPQLPTLLGFNKHEGIFLTIEIPNSVLAFRSILTVDTDQIPNYNKDTLKRFIKNPGAHIIGAHLSKPELDTLINKTIEYYADACNETQNYRCYLEQYTNLISDLGFIVPLVQEAYDRAQKGSPVYVFEFDHVNSDLKAKLPFRAVSHGGEYPYFFGTHIFGYFDLNKQDHKAKQVLVSAFANFVKTGNPSTSKLKWSPLRVGESAQVAVLKTFPYVDSRLESLERVKFWTKLSRDYDVDIIRGVKKSKLQSFTVSNDLKTRAARAQLRI